MDFDDTPEEAAVRAAARTFLAAHASAFAGGDGRTIERCRAWQRTLADGGWAAITWPVEHGGRGAPTAHEVVFRQEEAAFGVSSGFLTATIALVGPTLLAHGTDDQRARYLGPLLRGDEVWCQLFSEPDAGSDLAGLRTTATRDGDEWVVNGQKVWTSGAQHADHGILLARTDPDAPKHEGITYFLVDMRAPGVEVRPLRQIDGATEFNEVFLTGVRGPAANVVGEVHGGWAVARTTLANESSMIGGHRGAVTDPDAVVALARKIGATADPLARQRVADAYIRARTLRFLGDRVQTAVRQGRAPGPEGSVLKLLWAGTGTRAATNAISLLGASPLVIDDGTAYWQQQLLRQFHWRIGGGTDEIHRNMIGERALGLAREPRGDGKTGGA
jgi:alkylation response protein AidB-like acyl-CoA dehydrogenase